MNASAPIVDLLLGQAWTRWPGVQAGGLAAWSVNVLLGTDALLPGDCPRSESGTATVADDGASPLTFARLSRVPSLTLPLLWGG